MILTHHSLFDYLLSHKKLVECMRVHYIYCITYFLLRKPKPNEANSKTESQMAAPA